MDHDNDNDIPLGNLIDSGLVILCDHHQPAWCAGDYSSDQWTAYEASLMTA